MFFVLVSWIFLLGIAAVIGTAILFVLKVSEFPHQGDRFIVAIWLGVLVTSATLLGLSLFLPLTPAVCFGLLILFAASLFSISSVRQDLRRYFSLLGWPPILGLGLLSMIAALNSTRIVEAYDTALYHYQFVRWLSEYGTVRGFALLQERFGTTSSWFALAAPFDSGPFRGRIAGLTGGLAILLSFFHFALAVRRVLYHRANHADWFLLGGYGLIIPICLVWTFEVSLSPDLPIWILTMLAGWLMLIGGEGNGRSESFLALPLLFAAGAFTVKLSAAPTVLIAGLFYWFNSQNKWVSRAILGVCTTLISVPVFAANVVSSACPLYPNSLLCLDVPWGVGKAAAKATSLDIRDWARWAGPAPDYATNSNWIVPWFLHADKLLLLSVCGLCLLGYALVRGWRDMRASLYVVALVLLGTCFVFLSAPNPRFGAGYLALCPAVFLSTIGPNLKLLRRRPLLAGFDPAYSLACLLAMIAVLLFLEGSYRERQLLHSMQTQFESAKVSTGHYFLSRLVLPPQIASASGDLTFRRNRKVDAPALLELTVERYNGIEYRRPVDGDQCWGATIPCLPHPLTGDVRLRAPSQGLSAGFIRSTIAP